MVGASVITSRSAWVVRVADYAEAPVWRGIGGRCAACDALDAAPGGTTAADLVATTMHHHEPSATAYYFVDGSGTPVYRMLPFVQQLEAADDVPLWKPPGVEMSYCQYGYSLLEKIVR